MSVFQNFEIYLDMQKTFVRKNKKAENFVGKRQEKLEKNKKMSRKSRKITQKG